MYNVDSTAILYSFQHIAAAVQVGVGCRNNLIISPQYRFKGLNLKRIMTPLRIRLQSQSLVSRTRLHSRQWPAKVQLAHRRGYAGVKEKLTTHPEETEPKGPNMEQAPHVSEEAAALSEIKGETGPDLNQGTPIAEVGELVTKWVRHMRDDGPC